MVPMVLPPVAAEPIAPPATAPPTVPWVSDETPRFSSASQPARPAARTMPTAIRSFLMSWPPVVKKDSALSRSVAAAQQENDEQDRDGHAKGPQQDVAKL